MNAHDYTVCSAIITNIIQFYVKNGYRILLDTISSPILVSHFVR